MNVEIWLNFCLHVLAIISSVHILSFFLISLSVSMPTFYFFFFRLLYLVIIFVIVLLINCFLNYKKKILYLYPCNFVLFKSLFIMPINRWSQAIAQVTPRSWEHVWRMFLHGQVGRRIGNKAMTVLLSLVLKPFPFFFLFPLHAFTYCWWFCY